MEIKKTNIEAVEEEVPTKSYVKGSQAAFFWSHNANVV